MALNTLSADGDTSIVVATGPVHIHGSGDFGSETITFYFEDDGGTYRAISGAAYTAVFDDVLDVLPGTKVKGTLASSTDPSLIVNIRESARI